MAENPAVVIVIVNWNKRDDTLGLLNSLETIDYDNHDIIVVDNASTDDSVAAIREQFPLLDLQVNPVNLGGTGGFNSGIRRALKKGAYKYIWLLDNDAKVEKKTLRKLVEALEFDESIGISGSRIVDPQMRSLTVEAGAFIKKNSIGVDPLYRNTKNPDLTTKIVDVDYVAICSALIRTTALEKIGLMDERYFIFWDDMDWGLKFKRNGFKVVCAVNSIAYHEAFTEKRGLLVDYYYGNRNSLLTYSKHSGLWKRIPLFYKYLREKSTGLVLLGFNGDTSLMSLGFSGIFDFILGNWGKRKGVASVVRPRNNSRTLPEEADKILILNDGSRDEIYDAFQNLKMRYPDADFTIFVNKDRESQFHKGFGNIIEVDTGKPYSLFYYISLFFTVMRKDFTISVSFRNSSPFSYATQMSYVFDAVRKEFYESGNSTRNIWKLVLSTAIAEIMSVLLLPVLWIASLRYKKE